MFIFWPWFLGLNFGELGPRPSRAFGELQMGGAPLNGALAVEAQAPQMPPRGPPCVTEEPTRRATGGYTGGPLPVQCLPRDHGT